MHDKVYITLCLGRYLEKQKSEVEERMKQLRATISIVEKDAIGCSLVHQKIYDWKKKQLFTELQDAMQLYEVICDSIIKNRIEIRNCLYEPIGMGAEREIFSYLHATAWNKKKQKW